MSSAASLYRVFDANGELVYIGSSTRAVQRLSAHTATSGWWSAARTVTVEHFASRAAARLAEARAIATENPRCNLLRPGMKRKPRKRHERVVVSLRLPADEHNFLRSIAESQQRSISGQVRFIVAELRAEADGGEVPA